jgi:hypothetical protein
MVAPISSPRKDHVRNNEQLADRHVGHNGADSAERFLVHVKWQLPRSPETLDFNVRPTSLIPWDLTHHLIYQIAALGRNRSRVGATEADEPEGL